MKKIMIICNSLNGLINFRSELIKKLLEQNFEIVVLAPENNLTNKLNEIGCNFIPIKMNLRGTNPFKDLKLIHNYKKILIKEKPNLVLTYTIKPNVYAGYICGKLHIPYIANVTGLGTAVEKESFIQKITLLLYKYGLKKAKCVFVQNKDNLNFLIEHKIIKGKYQLIPGSGVNLKHHKLLPYPKDKTIKFLFISRILYEKGIDDYLECAKYVKEKYPNTEFHILGNCDDKNYLIKIKEFEKNKIVIYHGRVNDVRKYQKISNCTIHPSFYPEGMSNVLLESCAAGRPIITTNRPGCKEIVEDGINGYLIECKDTKALIEKTEKFINLSLKEKEKMGKEGRKKVEKEFDRNIVVRDYIKEIEANI